MCLVLNRALLPLDNNNCGSAAKRLDLLVSDPSDLRESKLSGDVSKNVAKLQCAKDAEMDVFVPLSAS